MHLLASQTSMKFHQDYVGPFFINRVFDSTQKNVRFASHIALQQMQIGILFYTIQYSQH